MDEISKNMASINCAKDRHKKNLKNQKIKAH